MNRVCFIHGGDRHLIKFPQLDVEGQATGKETESDVDVHEFRTRFSEVCLGQSITPLKVMQRVFGGRKKGAVEVCPLSVVPLLLSRILILAEHCERYGVLADVGSVLSQSNWLMEAFDLVSQAKAIWEKERLEVKKK